MVRVRHIAEIVPVREPDVCAQCGFVCPHAVIRAKYYDASRLDGAAATFQSAPINARGFPDVRFTLANAIENCAGCGLCVGACPAHSVVVPDTEAINMRDKLPIIDEGKRDFGFFNSLPINDRARVDFAKREVAASKRKGMRMGGLPPLGCDVRDRKLVVDAAEAAIVQRIFRDYLELGAVRPLQERLAADGITSKPRVSAGDRRGGGRPLTRGNLYRLLQNRLYRGEVVHRDASYAGEHDAIIDADLRARVQARLAENRVAQQTAGRARQPSLLAGLLND